MVTSEYNGIALRFDPDTEMGSLTAMYEAAGKPDGKEPWRWRGLDQTESFLTALAHKLNLVLDEVYKTRQGRDGGSWSHWPQSTERRNLKRKQGTMTLANLETKRRAAQRQLDQALAPQRQLELAQAELENLDEQIGQARAAEAAQRRAQQQHESQVASAWARYNAVAPELRTALRDIQVGRMQLIELGEPDPGDRVISVEAIAKPLIERDRL